MCGLGGFAGIQSKTFVKVLGTELDSRGGHAAGYVTDRHRATRVGAWSGARGKWNRRASEGAVGILHTRYATCGTGSQSEAHPFEIRRGGQAVLYGAHNGIVDTHASAMANDREYTVDSRELFELIADGDYDTINRTTGYGVVSWIVPGDASVYLARLTECGELCVVSIKGGGYAWASTWELLYPALRAAGLTAVSSFPLDPGIVYRITPTEIRKTAETRCHLAPRAMWGWDWSLDDDELDACIAQDDQLDTLDPWDDDERWMNVGRVGA